jgi:drug/metabolite transporter (DMT)-like permease
MINVVQIILILLSGVTIAVADALIKKISIQGGFWVTMMNPLMWIVYILYFVQIVFAVVVFLYQKELAVYSNIFLIFYSFSSLALGFLMFKEHINTVQLLGILLAIVAVMLMNYH